MSKDDRFDPDHAQTNRQKVRAPRRFWEWCPGCDRDVIYPGKNCNVCGTKSYTARDKK
jgi:rRNA maturation endonuclease Nob1